MSVVWFCHDFFQKSRQNQCLCFFLIPDLKVGVNDIPFKITANHSSKSPPLFSRDGAGG